MNKDTLQHNDEKIKSSKEEVCILLTLSEVAAMLGINKRTVYRLSSLRILPKIIKLGHLSRMSRSAVIEAINTLERK